MILDCEGEIFIPSLFITLTHFPEKRTWQCDSWGEFYYFISDFKPNRLISISDMGCGVDVLRKMKEISQRYVELQNDSRSEEFFKFKNLKMWNRAKDTEEYKYKKALTYLLNHVFPCCQSKCTSNCSNRHEKLVFRLINLIFFNKT